MKFFTKNYFFGIVIGFCLALTLVATPILAAGGTTSLQVVLNNVNVLLDGAKVASLGDNYILSNGSSVPNSILYKGTTYLPIRKLSELLGKDVGYISETKTIILGQVPVASTPGWYLIDEKFVTSESDYYLNGYVVSSTMSGQELLDKYTAEGDDGSYLISHSRSSGGNVSYFGNTQVNFSPAPSELIPGRSYSMTLSNEYVAGDWSFATSHISFSSVEEIGYGTSSDFYFVDENGRSWFESASGTVSPAEEIREGNIGDIRYVKVTLGHGYGYVYTYEWME